MGVRLGILAALALGTLAPGPVHALDLSLPGNAVLTREELSDPDTYNLPAGPFVNGAQQVRVIEGRVVQQAWRIEGQGLTTLQLLRPLKEQLSGAGYDLVFECRGQECGGFDFRFNTRVIAAPDMYIDLFDFRYLAMQKGSDNPPDGPETLSVIVSRAGGAGYVQLTHVAPGAKEAISLQSGDTDATSTVDPVQSVARSLIEKGHVILDDLDFGTGSASLGPGPHASLEALGTFLRTDAKRRIVLVGHTDAQGSLENNIALSQRRAASVLERLVSQYNVPRGQLDAHGTGYLAPIAPNLTTQGREANRRVEAVLLNIQ